MEILLVGLNHKTAPLEVRESVSFLQDQLPGALNRLRDRVGEGVILSTCNRTEIYTVASEQKDSAAKVLDFISDFHGLSAPSVAPHLYEHVGEPAVHHLFRVAAGLDSLIIGESQILGQVRDSLSAASESGSVNVSTVGLFHAAVRAGRKVREDTEVGRNPLSISFAAVRLARQILGGLEGRRVLLVGAGEAGQLVARALRTVGVADLVIANRTRPRAEELADYLNGRAISFSELGPALNDADIVISATDAPDYVITHDMVSQACIKRDGGGLFLFDLAMPRDIDPRVGKIGAVSLYNMDDLSAIAEENLEERKKAAQDAEAVVDGEVRRFMAWWASLDVMPVIRSLRQQAEDIRERELERALSLMNALSPEDSKVVEALTHAIVNKLLHAPTESLRQGADKAQLAAAMDLFRLWDGDGPSPFGKDVAWNNEGSETRETGR